MVTLHGLSRSAMRPYSVEIFRPDFTMVGNTNVNEVTYKEDYLASDENTMTESMRLTML